MTAPVSWYCEPWQGHCRMLPSGATVHAWWVQVASRAVSFPPLWVISRMRPVESFTETEVSVGTSASAMIPLTAVPPEPAGPDAGAVVPDAEVEVEVEPEGVLELPQAARSATPPTPAPRSSCRRTQLKGSGAGAVLSVKTASGVEETFSGSRSSLDPAEQVARGVNGYRVARDPRSAIRSYDPKTMADCVNAFILSVIGVKWAQPTCEQAFRTPTLPVTHTAATSATEPILTDLLLPRTQKSTPGAAVRR